MGIGQSFAFGWNKHGQLGSGSLKNETEDSPVRCLVSEVNAVAYGGEFTVWLTSTEGSSILTAGLPQYGQLGHGTDNEYNTKDSSVRLAYEPQSRPKAIALLAGETIVKVACGTNHTVAVDSNGHVYTWGFGGYGRLGHREQKDEFAPRRVDVFQRQNVLPADAIISAGGVNSSCTAAGGQLYMWGNLKNTGDDWMYTKPLMDLRKLLCYQILQSWENENVETRMNIIESTVRSLRSLKSTMPPNEQRERRPAYALCRSDEIVDIISSHELEILTLASVSTIKVIGESRDAGPGCAVDIVNEHLSVYLKVKGAVSAEAEREKMRKKMHDIKEQVKRLEDMMSASGYKEKVPAHIHKENEEKVISLKMELLSVEEASQHLEQDFAAENQA